MRSRTSTNAVRRAFRADFAETERCTPTGAGVDNYSIIRYDTGSDGRPPSNRAERARPWHRHSCGPSARTSWSRREVMILNPARCFCWSLLFACPCSIGGLPPTTVEVAASDIRSSYAFDEDDILTGVSFARTAQFDLDPRRYHWGMLHFHLLQILLDGAQAVGYFEQPSARMTFIQPDTSEFERVYALARGLSVLFGLLGVLSVYLLTHAVPTGLQRCGQQP